MSRHIVMLAGTLTMMLNNQISEFLPKTKEQQVLFTLRNVMLMGTHVMETIGAKYWTQIPRMQCSGISELSWVTA